MVPLQETVEFSLVCCPAHNLLWCETLCFTERCKAVWLYRENKWKNIYHNVYNTVSIYRMIAGSLCSDSDICKSITKWDGVPLGMWPAFWVVVDIFGSTHLCWAYCRCTLEVMCNGGWGWAVVARGGGVLFSVHCVYFLQVRGYWSGCCRLYGVKGGEGSQQGRQESDQTRSHQWLVSSLFRSQRFSNAGLGFFRTR